MLILAAMLLNERDKKKAEENKTKQFYIEDFGARPVDKAFDIQIVAWRAQIHNNTSAAIRLDVEFIFLDDKDFELDHGYLFDVSLPANASETFSSRAMLKSSLWDQVKSYSVKAKPN